MRNRAKRERELLWRFMVWYKDDLCFWFRIFGYGIRVIDRTKQDAVYSSRKTEYRIGKYGVKILKPLN